MSKKEDLKNNGYLSLKAICLRLGRNKDQCSIVPQDILNLATMIGNERYFSPENIPIVEEFLNKSVSEKRKRELPEGYKSLKEIMKDFKSSYVPPKELLIDGIECCGHTYYGEKTISLIRSWLFEYDNITNISLKILGRKVENSVIPNEFKIGGLKKSHGIVYPPEQVKKIEEWLTEYEKKRLGKF